MIRKPVDWFHRLPITSPSKVTDSEAYEVEVLASLFNQKIFHAVFRLTANISFQNQHLKTSIPSHGSIFAILYWLKPVGYHRYRERRHKYPLCIPKAEVHAWSRRNIVRNFARLHIRKGGIVYTGRLQRTRNWLACTFLLRDRFFSGWPTSICGNGTAISRFYLSDAIQGWHFPLDPRPRLLQCTWRLLTSVKTLTNWPHWSCSG